MNFVISVGQIATSRLYALPLPLPEPLQNSLCWRWPKVICCNSILGWDKLVCLPISALNWI